jgi:hypothetical protein
MPKLKLDAKTIQPYLQNIDDWHCNVPWFWDMLSAEEIAESWNGVGSDLTPKYIRKGLTRVYGFATEGVIIHDVIFTYKKKFGLTEADFYRANEDLKINARICLKHNPKWVYSKWNQPYYSWCYSKAWLAEDACNRFGLDAWNTNNEEEKGK